MHPALTAPTCDRGAAVIPLRRNTPPAAHPAGRRPEPRGGAGGPESPIVRDPEDGSLIAEYGLLMVLGATIAALAIKWATGGAIWELFGALLTQAKSLVNL